MLCVDDISEGIENAPNDFVSGCGGTTASINCGLMVIGKKWLNQDVYNDMVECVNTMGVTRLFTQHMINRVVPEFNLLPDDYNWKVSPSSESNRLTHEYGITDKTKIIHWAGALPDTNTNRKPYLKPWEQDEDSNNLSKLWYQYKREMLEEVNYK